MITYLNLGKKGNLGNQLFQVASTLSIATRNNQDFAFPKWKYNEIFNRDLPVLINNKAFKTVKESNYNYNDMVLPVGDFSLNGWFQSEKYFKRESVKKQFEFKPALIEKVKEKFKNELARKHILISVRRGDFVHHPYYFQLDYKFYFLAIISQFNDWEQRRLIFTSDDINYCKTHFSHLPNAIFVENTLAEEQLVLGSLCNDFIISNSTFSWWLAWLGEKESSKIVRPIQNFRGKFRIKNNDEDYFPDRWISFNSNCKKLPAKYNTLVFKAEILKIISKFNHYLKSITIKIKKQIKKVIRRF